jgi:hypothetical protein
MSHHHGTILPSSSNNSLTLETLASANLDLLFFQAIALSCKAWPARGDIETTRTGIAPYRCKF